MISVPTERGSRLSLPVSPIRARDLAPIEHAVADGDRLAVLHRSAEITEAARHTLGDRELFARLDALIDGGGAGAFAAIEILGALIGDTAAARLAELLTTERRVLRRHASWQLGEREPVAAAVPALLHELRRGGIDTFHAHRTLRHWSRTDAASILRALTTTLAVTDEPAERSRLVDLLGAIDDRGTDEFLVDLAVDPYEPDAARIAAVGALGERPSALVDDALTALVHADDAIAAHAAFSLERGGHTRASGAGLHVAQLVLAEGLDGQLSRGGQGETGGVASLLVSLGDALGSHPAIGHVTTIGRGTVTDALIGPLVDDDGPWSYGTIPLGDVTRPVSNAGDAWEHIPAVERGVRRALHTAGRVDVLHLRMADVGTLVGAEVAAAAGIPTCFSLAPDPHNVIQSLQRRGELDGDRFEQLDLDQNTWFRARLVERLGRHADRVALFPRATSFPFLDSIVADDARAGGRTAVVAEGIDLASLRRAECEADTGTPDVIRELHDRLAEDRRGRPVLISVGRLHPVKGMERVVEAWASNPRLRERCNLVIVGGDLGHPSTAERAVLDQIETTLDRHPTARDGLVLLGGRPHADIARLLVSVRRGRAGAWAPGGVYVDGAMKEEFGLAVLEAMAAGLVVVAPSTGGPSTYVEPGDTGVLVEPGDPLDRAIVSAFGLVDLPGRSDRARRMVETRYSIGTMASQLVDLYSADTA
ncbi:MAG: glycosyltransferase [Ilumatobacteraceae bacterium]|nr:glycosyltransferase [Ilumatobacteraceae bacterium]